MVSLKVSKWIKIPLLIDVVELKGLLIALEGGVFYDVQRVVPSGGGVIAAADFVAHYAEYIEHLQTGRLGELRMAPVMSRIPEALFEMDVGEGRGLMKPCLPVLQFQANRIGYSPLDQSFRTQIFGAKSISWGMLIGYPQIYQDAQTLEIHSTQDFPNTPLFKALQKWVRKNTLPTSFVVEKKRHNEPIRLGKRCFSWIHRHPQLNEYGITIETPKALHPQQVDA